MTVTIHQHPSTYSPDEAAQLPGPEGWELRHVDPSAVLDNPDNARRPERDREGLAPPLAPLAPSPAPDSPDTPRRPERDREGLAPSIAALGILPPPLVRTTETGELVL